MECFLDQIEGGVTFHVINPDNFAVGMREVVMQIMVDRRRLRAFVAHCGGIHQGRYIAHIENPFLGDMK